MRTVQLGTELPSGEFLLKRSSIMTFEINFWEDELASEPSDLTGVVVTIEVQPPSGPLVIWTANNFANRCIWTLTTTDTDVTWTRATFAAVFTRAGDRDVIISGSVRVQG
jgi:hypothetical protein